jgi:hypothetical protein
LRPAGRRLLALESLEDRALLSVSPTFGSLSASGDVVVVNATQSQGSVGTSFLGVNLVSWDWYLNTGQTQQMVQNAGLGLFRFPGGSESDEFHFNLQPANQPVYSGPGTVASMANFIASVNGRGIATLNYGSGSPQEAAAFLAYLNAPTTSTTPIGFGEEWSTNSGTWVQTDWKTAGYWAAFRAATPLAHDDGLNFLRASHPAPFGIHYVEVGNEIYGSWETDYHGQGGDSGKPHDPATYVAFAKQFANYAQQIDPTISIGVDTGGVDTWTANVLQQCASQGFTPGFLSDHNYVQEPGSENDSTLLLHTVSDPTNTSLDWANRAAGYRSLLQQKLGATGAGVALLATEFNSVSYDPGKQTTSLVNGLFTADSLGSLLNAGYTGGVVWDVRNSFETTNNNSPSLYGWRQGGDYGLLGSDGAAPSTGPYVPYPTYFAEQLVGKMVQPGDSVVQASSNDPNLSAYAVQQTNGHLDLLVINKNATTNLAATFQVSGFQAAAQAQIWQYGKVQDTAQSQTPDGHSALANFVTNLPLSGANFTYTFPSYSMTVIDLAVAPPKVTNVLVGSTNWNATFLSYLASQNGMNVGGYSIPVGSGSQLATLPWGNINQIKVVFSENVVVDQSDLALSGVNVSQYDIAGSTFAYDPTTFTATWTLPQAIGPDKLLLALNADGSNSIEDSAGNRLDGEWTNPTSTTQPTSSTYPSGNGTVGGNFDFRLNVLPGDATLDGSVTAADLGRLLANFNGSGTYTSSQGDFNGDGKVTAADLGTLLADFNKSLPSGEPVAGSFPASISLATTVMPMAVSNASAISIAPVTTVATPATSAGAGTDNVGAIAHGPGADLKAATAQKLGHVPFVIGARPGSSLGEAAGNRIDLNTKAARNGWFGGSTPGWDEEVAPAQNNQPLATVDPRIVDRMDLFTVVEHELGHDAGLSDLDALTDDVMSGVLGSGIRRNVSHLDAALASL